MGFVSGLGFVSSGSGSGSDSGAAQFVSSGSDSGAADLRLEPQDSLLRLGRFLGVGCGRVGACGHRGIELSLEVGHVPDEGGNHPR